MADGATSPGASTNPGATQWVYGFGGGSAEGSAAMKNLLGGKGANLAEMSSLGLPVPPGFTITTEACNRYYADGKAWPAGLEVQVSSGLAAVEKITGKAFGDAANPLLVSVRSGARASMPGMMDTVLNLGLNDETVEGLANLSGDRRFAFDSYRRFIQMYSNVVLGLEHGAFEDILDDAKDRLGVSVDTALTAADWETLVGAYKAEVKRQSGAAFPQDPQAQLWGAVGAVFASWMNDRAKFYRRMHDIPESWGTAVNVQSMVFGNMGETSATGGGVHAQSVHRRSQALRRVPDQRPGRGRGGRDPHAAGPHQGRAGGDGGEGALYGRGYAASVRPVPRRGGAAGDALSRHARY